MEEIFLNTLYKKTKYGRVYKEDVVDEEKAIIACTGCPFAKRKEVFHESDNFDLEDQTR